MEAMFKNVKLIEYYTQNNFPYIFLNVNFPTIKTVCFEIQ